MAILQYGAQSFRVHMNDEAAALYRAMIHRIVEAGDTAWIPLPMQDGQVLDILISPGIEVTISGMPWTRDTMDYLDELADRYADMHVTSQLFVVPDADG